MSRLLFFIKAICLFLVMSSRSFAAGYGNIFNVIKFSHVVSSRVNNSNVIYHGHSKSSADESLRDISKMSERLSLYYKDIKKCRDITLHIYAVDYDVLNDRDIATFVRWRSNEKIRGLYDTTKAPSQTGSIFIVTKYDKKLTSSILAHELAHYWQHTHCISQSETEADEFSQFYITGKT